MKNLLPLFFAFNLLIFCNSVLAHGDEEHEKSEAGHEAQGHHAEGKEQRLEGQLIGLTCFIKHGGTGESHTKCARECAEKGLPLGVLTEAGKIYQISGEGHATLKETNAKLLKYVEKKVIVMGKAFEKNGIAMLVVTKIKQK